ncbi:unnamed protein product, partial [Cuscuta epithymum]
MKLRIVVLCSIDGCINSRGKNTSLKYKIHDSYITSNTFNFRYLHELKKDVKNKAKVEGSICNAYLVREASNFCSHYFEPHVYTRSRKVPRNDDGGGFEENGNRLMIFKHLGRCSGKVRKRRLTPEEYLAAHTYILLNCEEVQPYIEIYENLLKELNPDISEERLAVQVEEHFASWFETYARNNDIGNTYLHDLSRRPLAIVKSYPVYFINGYKFHTESYGLNKSTMNYGVCITGAYGDYYGKLQEILEVEYPALPLKRTVLFKCEWYDPTPNIGVKVHKQYNLVELNQRRRFNKFEPFILAMQATQVSFVSYPCTKRVNSDWLAVCKIRPRGWMDASVKEIGQSKDDAFQEDVFESIEIMETTDEAIPTLCDSNVDLEIPDRDSESGEDVDEFVSS